MKVPRHAEEKIRSALNSWLKISGNSCDLLSHSLSDTVCERFPGETEEQQRSRLSISEKYVNDFKNGRNLSLHHLNNIANFLGIDYEFSNWSPSHELIDRNDYGEK